MGETVIAENKETFEVVEPEKVSAPVAPTREELKGAGWSSKELDLAEKRDMVLSPEKAAEQKKEAATKAKVDADTKAKAEADAKAKDEKKDGEGKKSSLPDFDFKTPEQEKAFLEAFGPGMPQRAMYFRMKANLRRAQAAEQERDRLKQENESLKVTKPKPDPVIDENGDVVDPDDQPMTKKQWLALEKERAETAKKEQEDFNRKAETKADAIRTQEEYTKSLYPDFDATVLLTQDLLKNLESLVPEKHKQAQIASLARQLQIAAASADQLDLDDFHGAMIAYEIGRLHPKYGQKADAAPNGDASENDGSLKDPKKGNGALTPDQMKRIEDNTQRRPSSASVTGGGGKRTIAAEDVDLTVLNGFNYAERQRFKQKHPDRYAKLMRG